ncbi:MAG: putative zinc-binding metallopeptidase [Bryobacterales bacterium]|nr:putative zinc-binding metallopeptidase [Bryobacterales bacterium]
MAGRAYFCRCGRPVFFRNSLCLACRTPLGYEPYLRRVYALSPASEPGYWQLENNGAKNGKYRRCVNLDSPAGCNWLVAEQETYDNPRLLCIACRMNRTIPDLSFRENSKLWGRLEAAKRRVVSSLVALGLPVASRVDQDIERGLAFDFLHSPASGPRVLTGHNDGIITINIEEADDAARERIREAMHEHYRTLLGHLRHEVGHYYWDRLIDGSGWIDDFRCLFGDERQDYDAALRRHYQQGAPLGWEQQFVSAYASVHPWEDWAETWAHYMHMVDVLDTALSFGLDIRNLEMEIEPFSREALFLPDDPGAHRFLSFLNAWIELSAVLNELSRSMGQPDLYPFVLPRPAVAKLHLIHLVIAPAAS